MFPGETVRTGAQSKCFDCPAQLAPSIQKSRSGFYIGFHCSDCHAPHSRESDYYETQAELEKLWAPNPTLQNPAIRWRDAEFLPGGLTVEHVRAEDLGTIAGVPLYGWGRTDL